MLTHSRPGRWTTKVAALLACLLAGAEGTPAQSSRLAPSPAQPLAQTSASSPTPSASVTPEKPILLTDPVPDPRQEGVVYFPQTGHTLRGAFLSYWQQYGALAQFGYPLTEEFFEPSGPDNAPLQVQYFERSRFELHPENAGSEYEVLLGLLGRQLSEKKGYPYGWYPLYGRAVDWSWVSGVIRRYLPVPNCEAMICGCVLLRYASSREQTLQLVSAANPRQAVRLVAPGEEPPDEEDDFGYGGTPYTVFGRMVLQDEPFLKCPQEPTRRGYLVQSSQDNPSQ